MRNTDFCDLLTYAVLTACTIYTTIDLIIDDKAMDYLVFSCLLVLSIISWLILWDISNRIARWQVKKDRKAEVVLKMSDFTEESQEALERLLEEEFEITIKIEETKSNDDGLHKQS
mgnify:CR=1 FL=1